MGENIRRFRWQPWVQQVLLEPQAFPQRNPVPLP